VILPAPDQSHELSGQPSPLDNEQLAHCLDEIADLLDAQSANLFRRHAYRAAAETVRGLTQQVSQIVAEEGKAALTRLPGIGTSIARTLARLCETGHAPLLDQLRAVFGPEEKLATIPGIGPKTAASIHSLLGIETLSDLQAAAYDGRLNQVPGIGKKRLQAVRETLAGRFRQPLRIARQPGSIAQELSAGEKSRLVADLLSVDDEYRRRAEIDSLLRVAPRRFNPNHEAWLPILETERLGRRYKVMYSNTARAHELDTVRDWVVISRDVAGGEGQWTVLTSRFGKLRGRRIVRGLERECAEHYAEVTPHPLNLFGPDSVLDLNSEQGFDAPLSDRGSK
jgi:Holliday junction resolvasome RuvABC DNA-binding subunit